MPTFRIFNSIIFILVVVDPAKHVSSQMEELEKNRVTEKTYINNVFDRKCSWLLPCQIMFKENIIKVSQYKECPFLQIPGTRPANFLFLRHCFCIFAVE
mmetsp:Transcript_6788/g.8565  ORF Transcript_6788/g.8565 Transcript_6788/m.8565 type:complete len:99 (+) Transcript_6788:182-478(+)